jgi:tRNA(Arg) A34 adenosine deaminase TadA
MINIEENKKYLLRAIDLAKQSMDKGGFPAGAVIVKDGEIIGEGISIGNILHDPTSHAEIDAIRNACQKLGTTDLAGATLYESLQSCVMCLSAANWAGVSRIVYAALKTTYLIEKGYYEGMTVNDVVNNDNTRQMELFYIPEFEKQSFSTVAMWEQKTGAK